MLICIQSAINIKDFNLALLLLDSEDAKRVKFAPELHQWRVEAFVGLENMSAARNHCFTVLEFAEFVDWYFIKTLWDISVSGKEKQEAEQFIIKKTENDVFTCSQFLLYSAIHSGMHTNRIKLIF